MYKSYDFHASFNGILDKIYLGVKLTQFDPIVAEQSPIKLYLSVSFTYFNKKNIFHRMYMIKTNQIKIYLTKTKLTIKISE